MSQLEAVSFSLAGFTFWVLADSTIKLAGESHLPAYEIVAFLGSFMAVFLLIYGLGRNQVGALWPRQPQRQFWRSCLDLGTNLFVVIALRHMPLALFYILVFSAPAISTVMAAMFLGERLQWQRSLAILAGFAGVVIAVDPVGSGRQGDWIGYGAALITVACFWEEAGDPGFIASCIPDDPLLSSELHQLPRRLGRAIENMHGRYALPYGHCGTTPPALRRMPSLSYMHSTRWAMLRNCCI